MGIGKRIKEARDSLGLTQEELAKIVGVTKAAIGNYETGVSHPKENVLYKLFKALNCDANFLFQDEIKHSGSEFKYSSHDEKLIKKYRALDERGKQTIDMALNSQYEIIVAKKETTALSEEYGLSLVAEEPVQYTADERAFREKMHRRLDDELDAAQKGQTSLASKATNGLDLGKMA